MIRKDTDELIAFLNEIYALDPEWMHAMVSMRLPCNQALTDHPAVQVVGEPGHLDACKAGLIGLLNGYCGVFDDGQEKGCGPIAGLFDDASGKLIGFGRYNDRR